MEVRPLEIALARIKELAPSIAADFDAATVTANAVLIDMETRAMDLSLTNVSAATAILFNHAYVAQKQFFASGLRVLESAITTRQTEQDSSQESWSVISRTIVISSLFGSFLVLARQHLDTKLTRLGKAATAVQQARFDRALQTQVAELRALAATHQVLHRTASGGVAPFTAAQAEDGSEKHEKQSSWIDEATASISAQGLGRRESDLENMKEQNALSAKRAQHFGILLELFSLCAFGVPVVSALMALGRAETSGDMQTLTLHMKNVEYLDAVLTSSAQLCALRGEKEWIARYDAHVDPILFELDRVIALAPDLASPFQATTASANDALVSMETEVLAACGGQKNLSAAQDIMFGPAYAAQKAIFREGLLTLAAGIESKEREHTRSEERFVLVSSIALIVSTLAQIAIGVARVILAHYVEMLPKSEDVSSADRYQEELRKLIQLSFTYIESLQSQGDDSGAVVNCEDGKEAGCCRTCIESLQSQGDDRRAVENCEDGEEAGSCRLTL
eukprot:TRINITY_DN51087_c0_g2_i1.p1 TRINITY_DN51087_c0_g2~~TRINITY_DN51087_c0_g2_i1.p1  ORF type:complete len:515 (-),score=79.97 TRINITY_DN51087_c0_g2_i1:134-1654(-)